MDLMLRSSSEWLAIDVPGSNEAVAVYRKGCAFRPRRLI